MRNPLDQIAEEIGTNNFDMVSSSGFLNDDGKACTRYTVRKVRSGKLFHLIGHANRVIKLASRQGF